MTDKRINEAVLLLQNNFVLMDETAIRIARVLEDIFTAPPPPEEEAPVDPLEKALRAVGFTKAAAAHPRAPLALALLAAFNGVAPEQLPEGARYFPNEATEKAWDRVGDAAREYFIQQLKETTNACSDANDRA